MTWLFWLFVLLVILPLTTLLHELGHALPALAHGAQDVTIIMGGSETDRAVFRRRVGRLELVLASWFPLFIGHVRASGPLSRRQQIQVILGGPLVSLLLVAVFVPLAYVSRDASELGRVLVQGTATAAFLGFVATALPMVYPRWWYGYAGKPSDMRRFIRLVRSPDVE